MRRHLPQRRLLRWSGLLVGLVVGLGLGQAETLLAPWFVPEGLPTAQAQPLRAWHERLQRESQTLLATAAQHNAACTGVPAGTPVEAQCRDELARLQAEVQRYNRAVQGERQAVWRALLQCQEATARYDREVWRAAEALARVARDPAALELAHKQRAAAEARLQQLQTPVADEFPREPLLPPKIACRDERLVPPSGEGVGEPTLRDYVPDQAVGVLLQVTGSVSLWYHGQWVRVGPHALIGPHDRLRTGPGSSATVSFGEGMLLLRENTTFAGIPDAPGLESVKDLTTLNRYFQQYIDHLQKCLPAGMTNDPACGGTLSPADIDTTRG